jgi:hypothetical protein
MFIKEDIFEQMDGQHNNAHSYISFSVKAIFEESKY